MIVPFDDNSTDLLHDGEDMEGNFLTFPIPKKDIDMLYKLDFFKYLNIRLNVYIDVEEKEEIFDENLLKELILTLQNIEMNLKSPLIKFYSERLIFMTLKALDFKTGVIFDLRDL